MARLDRAIHAFLGFFMLAFEARTGISLTNAELVPLAPIIGFEEYYAMRLQNVWLRHSFKIIGAAAFIFSLFSSPGLAQTKSPQPAGVSQAIPTDQDLTALWNQYFAQPKYYDGIADDASMSPFCLTANSIFVPGSNHSLISLHLLKILRGPMPGQFQDQPNYLFLSKVIFLDKEHNSYYHDFFKNDLRVVEYIGVGLSAVHQPETGYLEPDFLPENVSGTIWIYFYSSLYLKDINNLSYVKAISSQFEDEGYYYDQSMNCNP